MCVVPPKVFTTWCSWAILGSQFAAFIANRSEIPGDQLTYDYTAMFSWPLWGSVFCFFALLIFYPKKSKHQKMTE